MKKSIVLSLVFLISLACGLLAPKATATPQVIFRSPKDINLQPGDLPDANEVQVQNPATKPLLPETEDQNQRAFQDKNKKIEIETDVILVADPTTRSVDDIYDHTVGSRRPNSHRAGKDKPTSIGERGYIISFADDTCGQGLVLIAIRSNIVMVIIICGESVNEDYLIAIGEIIDGRITEAIKPGNVVGVTAPPGIWPTTDADQCTRLHLTPEECANAGKHTYNAQEVGMTGKCQRADDFVCTISLNFTADGVYHAGTCTFSDGYQSSASIFLTKVGENQYTYSTGNVTGTTRYTLDGFKSHGVSTYADGATCESDDVYTRK